jgi:hypothetical protein
LLLVRHDASSRAIISRGAKVSFVSNHSCIGAVIARRANNLCIILSNSLMRLVVSRLHWFRVYRCFRAIITSWADHALALILQSGSVTAESSRWARPLLTVGSERTKVTLLARQSLVFGALTAFSSHGAQLTIRE